MEVTEKVGQWTRVYNGTPEEINHLLNLENSVEMNGKIREDDFLIRLNYGEISVLRLVIARMMIYEWDYLNDSSFSSLGSVQDKITKVIGE